jgi:hypothetical protein
MEDFLIINPENIKALSKKINSGKGKVLFLSGIGGSEIKFPEAGISVYFKSNVKGNWLYSNDSQNRFYMLREKRIYPEITKEQYENASFRERLGIESMLQHKAASSFFEKLDIGNFEFKINNEMTVGRGIPGNEITLYANNLEKSIEYALTRGISKINQILEKENKLLINQKDIESIIDYINSDLKTDSILKKNIQAGRDADAYCGL